VEYLSTSVSTTPFHLLRDSDEKGMPCVFERLRARLACGDSDICTFDFCKDDECQHVSVDTCTQDTGNWHPRTVQPRTRYLIRNRSVMCGSQRHSTAGPSRDRRLQRDRVAWSFRSDETCCTRHDLMPQKAYVMKISLVGSQPAIWRRICIPGETTLDRLHDIIQIVMGWQECYLHSFSICDQPLRDNRYRPARFRDRLLARQAVLGYTFRYTHTAANSRIKPVLLCCGHLCKYLKSRCLRVAAILEKSMACKRSWVRISSAPFVAPLFSLLPNSACTDPKRESVVGLKACSGWYLLRRWVAKSGLSVGEAVTAC